MLYSLLLFVVSNNNNNHNNRHLAALNSPFGVLHEWKWKLQNYTEINDTTAAANGKVDTVKWSVKKTPEFISQLFAAHETR